METWDKSLNKIGTTLISFYSQKGKGYIDFSRKQQTGRVHLFHIHIFTWIVKILNAFTLLNKSLFFNDVYIFEFK